MFYISVARQEHISGAIECFATLDFDGHRLIDESTLASLVEQQAVFVALNGRGSSEQVVGAMALNYDDQSYEIRIIACRPDYIRKGVGTALIRQAVNKCRTENVPKLWCWSMDRYNAKTFYEKQGFGERFLLHRQFFGEDCWFIGMIITLHD